MSGQSWEDVYLPEGPSHYQWTKDNCTKHTKQQIAEKLGRSVTSVSHKLKHEGWLSLDDLPIVQGVEVVPQVEGIPIESLLKAIKDKPRSLDELSQEFDRSRDTMRHALEHLQTLSYEITQTERQQHVWSTQIPKIVAPPTILWDKAVWKFKLGAISDSHDGSKASQMSARNRAIGIMYDYGVRDILVIGDIFAGRNVYRGQHLDVVSMEPDDQVAISEAYWPHKDDLRYHMMGGNHDYSIIKSSGYNALKALCGKRGDFFYYGYDLVTVPLTENVDALLWHPSGFQSYAMSYRSQKMVEQIAFEQLMEVLEKNVTPKVRFLFVGHWHNIIMGYRKGPIWVQHTGGFEGQNNLTRRMGIFPQINGVILEGEITKDRNIIRDLTVRHLSFTEIENDYMSYPIPQKENPVPEPLFQWKQ